MKTAFQSEKIGKSILVLCLISVQWFVAEGKLPACSKSKEGNQTLYRKVSGNYGTIACIKNNGRYVWKFLDGSSTLGEEMNPAKDCSDVVDNIPEAKDGFYWLTLGKGKPSKAWCDTHTDGGGFLLVGMKNSPVTWNVSSNKRPVDPLGPPHWSTRFGDVNVRDFAVQISTTKNFEDTKAHWSYRLKKARFLGNLFGIGGGGCTDFHSGIGNVAYVKDILSGKVVTRKFKCSKFGPYSQLGWGRMNYCLRNKCPSGYAHLPGFPVRLDDHGSFSFSASSEFSGITHNATAFVGCDSRKCCACFGPKGGKGHYCGRKCKALNGGTVLTGRVYVWFWIRTRLPQRVWKRCMEFKMKTQAGKLETHFIDKETGAAHKGTCSEQFQTFLNEGTLTVENKKSFQNLPPVPGMISYREDSKKLYVNNGNKWDAIGSEAEITKLMAKVSLLKKNVAAQDKAHDSEIQSLKSSMTGKLAKTERKLMELFKNFQKKWPSGKYCILANGKCPSGFVRHYGFMVGISTYDSKNPRYMRPIKFGDSKMRSNTAGNKWGDLYITACCK